MQHSASKIRIVFQRQRHVDRNDFSVLLDAFSPERMTPEGLRLYCGSVQILFGDYCGEQRLPFVIPEIRQFLRNLRNAWPYAPFFCDFGNDFMGIETMAHLDTFRVLQRDGSSEIYLWVATDELESHVEESQAVIEMLGKRCGMPKAQIRKRQGLYSDYIAVRLGSDREA
jgi:hypothetical protein